ncbi:MAG TPA: ATP-binding protein, partial [Syntrophales bacterium]|nr:ATP-binding protein [Syntrophales bacterium]
VADTGCGMSEEDLSNLFNPFFTKKQYGTGLGLTQVKKIVDLHDGTLEVASRPGEGTRITLKFGDTILNSQPVDIVNDNFGKK